MKLHVRRLAALVLLLMLTFAGPGLSAAQAQEAAPRSWCTNGRSALDLGTFSGTAPAELGPVYLQSGLAVVCGQSSGDQNLAASLSMPDPGVEVANSYTNRYLMIDAVGRYNGGSAALIEQPGWYSLVVSLASGPYTLSVSQPAPETVTPLAQTTFRGRGQQVTAPFTLPAGSYSVSIQGESRALRVWLYALDGLGGRAITTEWVPQYDGRLIDTAFPPGYTSVPVALPDDGTYLLYVDAGGGGASGWTITIQ